MTTMGVYGFGTRDDHEVARSLDVLLGGGNTGAATGRSADE
jgi:hypothetical protein